MWGTRRWLPVYRAQFVWSFPNDKGSWVVEVWLLLMTLLYVQQQLPIIVCVLPQYSLGVTLQFLWIQDEVFHVKATPGDKLPSENVFFAVVCGDLYKCYMLFWRASHYLSSYDMASVSSFSEAATYLQINHLLCNEVRRFIFESTVWRPLNEQGICVPGLVYTKMRNVIYIYMYWTLHFKHNIRASVEYRKDFFV